MRYLFYSNSYLKQEKTIAFISNDFDYIYKQYSLFKETLEDQYNVIYLHTGLTNHPIDLALLFNLNVY